MDFCRVGLRDRCAEETEGHHAIQRMRGFVLCVGFTWLWTCLALKLFELVNVPLAQDCNQLPGIPEYLMFPCFGVGYLQIYNAYRAMIVGGSLDARPLDSINSKAHNPTMLVCAACPLALPIQTLPRVVEIQLPVDLVQERIRLNHRTNGGITNE